MSEAAFPARLLAAASFAAAVHATHRRKGAAAEPYINHPLEVACILAEHGAPEAVIIAGLLHDTVEDSGDDAEPVTLDTLATRFGKEVAGLVAEVSDDKSLPKETRKALQITGAMKKSVGAKMLKLADKTSNLRAIVAAPPATWSLARRLEYIGWAGQVAVGLRGVNPALEALFDQTHRMALAELAQAPAPAPA